MLELGLSTSLLGNGGLLDHLSILGEYGVPWVEIHGYVPEEFDYTDSQLADATTRLLERHGLRLWCCHSPAYKPLDVASLDPEVRRISLEAMRHSMRVAADMGARVFLCDAISGRGDEDQRRLRLSIVGESLRELLDDAGRTGVRLVIENHSRGFSLFATPQDFHNIVAQHALRGLGACWDTGHGWLSGEPPETACALGADLLTIHVHDNDGRKDLHHPPTEGGIPDWEPFVACLRQNAYSGPFMMELAPANPQTPEEIRTRVGRAVEIYRRLVTRGAAAASEST